MNDVLGRKDALREAFRSGSGQRFEEGAECPPPEALWDGAHGLVTGEEIKDLLEHVARCPLCAADWARAREKMEPQSSAPPQTVVQLPPRRRLGRAWVAAAAVLVAALVAIPLIVITLDGPKEILRGAEELEITSELADDVRLPRDAAWLRWSALESGTRYSVTVDTVELEPVARSGYIDEAAWQIPEAALRELATPTEVVWRVEARLPDGRSARSPAFLATIE